MTETRDGSAEIGLPPFTLGPLIAEGDFARVYRVTAGQDGTRLLKVIHPSFGGIPGFGDEFVRLAGKARRLAHPGIQRLLQAGRAGDHLWALLEDVVALPLDVLLSACRDRGIRLPRPSSLRITAEILESLEYAHTFPGENDRPLSLLHGDLMPPNVFITPQGRVVLSDLGIYKGDGPLDPSLSGGPRFGYFPPERFQGQGASHRGDIFSAGAILFELLTGVRLAEAAPLFRRDGRPPTWPCGPDDALEPVVRRALALEPRDRFDSARTFRAVLRAVAADPGDAPSLLAALVRDQLALPFSVDRLGGTR